ncbi:MAG: L,D-transpeptidase [Anaerolineae bacterium]
MRLARSLVVVLFVLSLVLLPSYTATAQGETTRTHTVAWGETLSGIAEQYGVSLAALQAANGLDSADYIYTGQQLVIPAAGEALPTATAAPVEAATPAPSTATGPTVHVVRSGETLLAIAMQYGVDSWAIVAANQIRNPRYIFVGQELVIPALGSTPEAAPTASPSEPAATSTPDPAATPTPQPEATPQPEVTPAPEGSTSTYVVQKGDNLSWIALQYNVTLQDLLAANDIANPSTIYAGTVLVIPAPLPPAPPPAEPPQPTVTNGKQIVVVLSAQRVYAFENGQLINEFLVSTGLPYTPTVQGDFAIYLQIPSQWMSGPGYSLPNVQWVSYFQGDYSFHGTWWHNNFGHPMSHGCVNMRNEDAQWLYEWAPLGTAVRVIP